MCAVHLMKCATSWSSMFFHFWELTGFITVSVVSFQFTNISSQFGDISLYVGNSGHQSRICTLEYFASLLVHKLLHWYKSSRIRDHSLASSCTRYNHLLIFGKKICWELFELSLLRTEKHTNWRNRPRHSCRMVWLKCYAYFNNM